jgi:hypothetical protein
MKDVLLSDWTLAAFRQREEERQRKEQAEMVVVPAQKETLSGKEPLRNEWTVAALQRRFTTLEQRIAALEQVVAEQRAKDHAEASHVQPSAESPPREVILSNQPALDRHRGAGQHERVQATTGGLGMERSDFAGEESLKPVKPKIPTFEKTGTLETDPIEFRFDEFGNMRPPRKRTRRFVSFVITALAAGLVGFGAAIYMVPIKKALHYQALAKRGFDSVYESLSTAVEQ